MENCQSFFGHGYFYRVRLVVGKKRAFRERLVREAEGYLELITMFVGNWEPVDEFRDRLALRGTASLDRLEEADQDHPYVLLLRGQFLRSMERFEDAIQPLRRSAERDPDNLHTWLALGWCYKRIHRLDLAIEALEEALAVSPEEPLIHYNLACYWSLAGSIELAVDHLAMAFDIDNDYRKLVDKEPDFDAIRNHPAFQELTSVIV